MPFVVLVSPGSFNPPTHMHLRFSVCTFHYKLARDALNTEGYTVLGEYMSPVNDAYKKKVRPASAEHRIKICQLACKTSQFVMVDEWEANQNTFQRTSVVLSNIKDRLCKTGLICGQSLKVMLICGSDLLKSFTIPAVWIPEQIKIICRDFGILCIRREGEDVMKIIMNDEILFDNKDNIKVIDELIPNQISSTRVRHCISRGLSVKYIVADDVIEYMKRHKLYIS
uniref:Nicotinamide-nucleotide adenylyltransferase n=1 Tax=Kalanchoe fedtschenkoi TaxID=63787 RepID=A0A7N0U2U7_KALFE